MPSYALRAGAVCRYGMGRLRT